jgi:enediyne biosynthesis protein E4
VKRPPPRRPGPSSYYLGFLILAAFLAGRFVMDRMDWRIPYNLDADPADLFETLEESERRGFAFRDAAESLGVRHRYRPPRIDPRAEPRNRSLIAAPGVAVADVDGDGWMDFFLPGTRQGTASRLYLNRRGRGFEDAAERWGVARVSREGFAPIGPTFFDYNNDGRPDLYVAGLGCARLYENRGGSFADVTERSGLGDCLNSHAGIPLDFDNDGRLDLYVLRYWGPQDYFNLADTYIYVNNLRNATSGGSNTLYRNNGDGTFSDVTATAGGDDENWSYDAAYADFNGDGEFELYVANDYGPDQIYAFREGRLVNVTGRRLDQLDRRQGMNTSLGDLEGDGLPDVYVSNQFLLPPYGLGSNFLWNFRGRRGDDQSRRFGVFHAAFAWGGAFGDFNLDGHEELYVANGFVSPDPAEARTRVDGAAPPDRAFALATARSLPGLLSRDITKWPSLIGGQLYGNQRDVLFLNAGGRSMWDVSKRLGLDAGALDGRAVARIDHDNNGALDLIVTYGNGPVAFLVNSVEPARRWIGFRLEGVEGTRDGAGAKITVLQGGRRHTRWDTAGRSGFLAGSDPRHHVGLRSEEPVDVTVRWPSGRVDRHERLSPGRYYRIREGALHVA